MQTQEATRLNMGSISRDDSVDEVIKPTVLPSGAQMKDTLTMGVKVKQRTLGGRNEKNCRLVPQCVATEGCVRPSQMPREAVADCNAAAPLLLRASCGSLAFSLKEGQVSGQDDSVHAPGKKSEMQGAASDSYLHRPGKHRQVLRRDEVAKAQPGQQEKAEVVQTRDEAKQVEQREWHREEEQQAVVLETRCLAKDDMVGDGTQVGARMVGDVASPQLTGEPGASAVGEVAELDARATAHGTSAGLWAAVGARAQQQHAAPAQKRNVKAVRGKRIEAAAQVDGGHGAILASCQECLHFPDWHLLVLVTA
jgi:hypothetical protein